MASTTTYSPYPNDEYTVGWICALPVEMAAAKGMMDNEHGKPQTPPQKADHNTYILGSVGEFNVVVACLPMDEIGSSSAAAVAKDMLFTFPSIRVGLLVGIGAGIPDYEGDDIHDIRLGDVVISSDKGNGGVVLYDFGKRLPDGSFHNVYALDRPPRPLRTALSLLKAEHQTRENKIPQYIREMVKKYPFMRKKGFTYPGQSADKLFSTGYRHGSGRSCTECDPAKQVNRDPENRPDTDPVIHYGVIATGSAVVKHAPTRDDIKQEHRAICLEMEAAGLMNNFPCVVIRGISDYADSHKNDQWQPYAAATAAACAKELLEYVQPRAVDGERVAKDILTQISEIRENVAVVTAKIKTQEELGILDWITPVDYAHQHNHFIHRRQEGTGQWFPESAEFQAWLKTEKQTLFCPGIPGAGKTILTAVAIEYLQLRFQDDKGISIAYIYCEYRPEHEQNAENMLASLLKQLARGQPSLPASVKDLHDQHQQKLTRPTFDEISRTLQSVAAMYSRVFIVVDALDECRISDDSRTKFLKEILKLRNSTATNIFATSRPSSEISKYFNNSLSRTISSTNGDILTYLNTQISLRPSDIIDDKIQDMIRERVLEAADGMFLLAQLHTDTLLSQPTRGYLKLALQALGKGIAGLDKTYEQAMERIEDQKHGREVLAKRILVWIILSKRPLSTLEVQHALAVQKNTTVQDTDFLPAAEFMLSLCAGLVTIDNESGIMRLVHYTAQEYFQRMQKKWFPEAESDITIACVTYLSFDTFKSGPCPTEAEFEQRLRSNPFYEYVTQNWGHHAREVLAVESREARDEVEALIISFLKNTAKVEASTQAMLTMITRKSSYTSRHKQEVPINTTGLHLAAYFGLTKVTEALLNTVNGTDPTDSTGRTPLSWAAVNGHAATVELLLERGAQLDSSDKSDQTPLSRAMEERQTATVKLLLERGAKVNYRYNPGWIYYWIGNRDDDNCRYKFFFDDDWRRTPLSRAAEIGDETIVELLLEHHAQPEYEDGNGQTPLSWAIEKRQAAVVKLLLERGAKVDHCYELTGRRFKPIDDWFKKVNFIKGDGDWFREGGDSWRRTPLSRAVEIGDLTVVDLLLEHHAQLDYETVDVDKEVATTRRPLEEIRIDLEKLFEMGFESRRALLAIKYSRNLGEALDWLKSREGKTLDEVEYVELKPPVLKLRRI